MDFVPAVLSLKNSKPEEVILKLHQMFATITKLDADEVAAAYQTTKTTAALLRLDHDLTIQAILRSLLAQMHLIVERPFGNWQRDRFRTLTGEKFDYF